MKYGAVAMYIAFLYCELGRRSWARRTRRGEIKTMDELRAEACTEDEVTLRNARSKVSAFMKKAGLSIEASEVSTMSKAMNPVDS